MELKLWISFLLLYVIPDAEPASNQWIINVPSTIPALQGSCVVIPCAYTYPKPLSKAILNRYRGFWMRGNTIVSTNLPKWKLKDEFKKRTRLVGKLKTRNCTMLLDSVRSTDVGPFYFKIDIPKYESHSFKESTVSIDVMRHPDPPSLSVEVNEKVRATCSVLHTCPSYLPQFSWNHAGIVSHRSKPRNKWQWETKSTLTFVPVPTDFMKTLNCTVKYRGGKQTESSIAVLV